MPTSAIDSLVFRNMFGDREVRQIWSDEYRTQCYLDWEAALARAQAGLGLIPQDAATEINRVCKLENIDFSRLEEESLNIGYPVLDVVHQIGHLCRGDAGNWCHWGATTQDVTDSATVFQIRASFDIIANKLDEAIAATANLARDHRDLPMAGRSNLQQAVPITFGFKMARLLATFLRHRDRLKEIRPRIEVFEFGGACGTLASLGEKGLAVQEALARELGLAQPDIAWHTERDRIAEAGCFLGLLTGTLAKFATDLKLMMQTEVGESQRAVRRQPRLLFDYAAKAQSDLLRLYHGLRGLSTAVGKQHCSPPWMRIMSGPPGLGKSNGSRCPASSRWRPVRSIRPCFSLRVLRCILTAMGQTSMPRTASSCRKP